MEYTACRRRSRIGGMSATGARCGKDCCAHIPERGGPRRAARPRETRGRTIHNLWRDQEMQLTGIHHLTAVTGDVRENHRFYTQALGMRLVKRSVNQDDVSAYHLFYADAVGSPGTDLTFFDWKMPRERRGTRSLVRTHLRVAGRAALELWAQRFRELDVRAGEIMERDGRLTLDFEDPEGQR